MAGRPALAVVSSILGGVIAVGCLPFIVLGLGGTVTLVLLVLVLLVL